VFGGSQGAASINRVLLDCSDEFLKHNIQMIWQTGKRDYSTISEKTKQLTEIKLFEFIDSMDYAYSASDLVVCRSGISTMMEAAYFGSAVVFVPYAFATDNHQEKNARAMVDANAAEMILDSELEFKFESEILELLNDDGKLSTMRKNIAKFSDKDAALKIANSLTELINSIRN
jgi:UDP-N-acetylglucosamine--N-acetylmuramyl-(pentapeptide) pyrophosphoryl-undecaprenol N-acetylglucosamine transferase